MTRRKTFDADVVPPLFWRREDVRLALAHREIGRLMGIYLATFPECTQTQFAILTQHDRSDISNFVRGTRNSRVADIDVLARIADGLAMPNSARELLGLAPVVSSTADLTAPDAKSVPENPGATNSTAMTGWYQPTAADRTCRIAICGSRSPECDNEAIDDVIRSLSRLLMNHQYRIDHGPMGIGIEIMTYIADHYRPPTLKNVIGVFGRANVVRNADFVIVVGGGSGTLDEVELAISMGKKIVPFVASGGAARNTFDRITSELYLHAWMRADNFDSLGNCSSGEEYVGIIEHILTDSKEHTQ
jgi:SLOG cluster4 family